MIAFFVSVFAEQLVLKLIFLEQLVALIFIITLSGMTPQVFTAVLQVLCTLMDLMVMVFVVLVFVVINLFAAGLAYMIIYGLSQKTIIFMISLLQVTLTQNLCTQPTMVQRL